MHLIFGNFTLKSTVNVRAHCELRCDNNCISVQNRMQNARCAPICIVGVCLCTHTFYLCMYNKDSRTGHMQNSTFVAMVFHTRINAHCCRRILNFSYPLSALYSFKCILQVTQSSADLLSVKSSKKKNT